MIFGLLTEEDHGMGVGVPSAAALATALSLSVGAILLTGLGFQLLLEHFAGQGATSQALLGVAQASAPKGLSIQDFLAP